MVMYHGRSIGRCIEWLRRLTPGRADHVQFGYDDGSIRIGSEVVIRRVTWDVYDTPTFAFVDESLNKIQEQFRQEMLDSEHCRIHYGLHPADIEALEGLEKKPFLAERVRKSKRPDVLASLLEKGLVEQRDSLVGFDTDVRGAALYRIEIEITPQARGFLRYLHKIEEKKA